MVTWARHGENLANVNRTFSFLVYDESLTERGRQQARGLAARLAAGPAPGRIVCSPLRRAAETAAILAEVLGARDVTADENLREVNVGSLDGRNDARSWATYNSVLDAWRHGDYAARFPDGEDCTELTARLRAAFTAMTGPGDDHVLAVAHGASIRAALPLLAAVQDPGHDLPTGGTARFRTTPGDDGIRLRLVSWDKGSGPASGPTGREGASP
jgi:broad specificity phosphatase PhoE